MSYSKREAPFSNAAIIVTCRTDDYGEKNPLAGIEFQRNIEKKAFNAGGKNWNVPAQNLTDFLKDETKCDKNEQLLSQQQQMSQDCKNIESPFRGFSVMMGKGLSRATRLGRPWKRERWRGGKIEGGLHGPCIIHTPCSIF